MVLRLILTAAIVGALLPASSPASAQVATGCLTGAGAIVRVAVGEEPARPCGRRQTEITLQLGGDDDEEEGGPERVPFFVTMVRDGPDQVLATNGPLEVFARCVSLSDSTFFQVKVTGDVDGWWITGGRDFPVDAGEDLSLFSKSTVAETRLFTGSDLGGEARSALAPDGSYIAIEPDTMALGLNILGHDCIVVGEVTLHQGALE